MSSLHPKTTQITLYSYDLMRDESGLSVRKIYLQRIIHEHSVPVKQLSKSLTPQNTALFSRPICFLKRTDINALPPAFKENGWSRFFEAMYFTVPAKNCPASMDPQERESKTVDLDETIRILTDLLSNSSTDQQLLPLIHNTLGIFYFKALGVMIDLKMALSHFKSAAHGGLAQAHISLGMFYANGKSVEQNIHNAIEHFKIAAKMGSIEALYQLGNIFATNDDKIEDSTPYFNQAAAKKHPGALFWLGYLASERSRTPGLTKKQKNDLEQKAATYYKEAAELDCVVAQLALGQAYVYGYLGLPRKEEQAIKYLTHATQNRSGEGASSLGVTYTKHLENGHNQLDKGFTYLLKACRYNAQHLEESVSNINKLLQRLNNSTSPQDHEMSKQLRARATAYIKKYKLSIKKENHVTSAPKLKNEQNQSDPSLISQTERENQESLSQYAQTLRNVHLKTLSPEFKKLFLEEEQARPERTKQLIETFLPSLSHFTNLYSAHISSHGPDNPELFIDQLVSTMAIDTQIFLLSRLYLLNARDIIYLLKILGKQHFFDTLVSVIPFHKWKETKLVAHIQMMLLIFYLRILTSDSSQIGKLMENPITSLNHLSESCYWEMCHLINFSNECGYHQSILEKLMIISMTYHMTQKFTDQTVHKLRISLITQIMNLPDFKDQVINEFDQLLAQYQNDAPLILENMIKLGILNIKDTVSVATKALKNHSQLNEYKIRSVEIVTFFNERYAHFHTERLEAERKAKEEAQALKAKELSEKESALRQILKAKAIKSQEETLKKLKNELQTKDYSEAKRLALQEDIKHLETLHQQTIADPSFSQKLGNKFQKTLRKAHELMSLQSSASSSINPTAPPTINPLPSLSSSSDKSNMKVEILNLLEEREALKSKKQIESTAKKEERAQARAPKRSEYEEAHLSKSPEPTPLTISDPLKLDSIHSFQDKVTEDIFTSQSDQYAGRAVQLLNLINRSKSIPEIRSQITHGQNLEPLIGQALKVKDIKSPLQQYSLRVNDQYRITFFWDKSGKNARNVWFGDYHT